MGEFLNLIRPEGAESTPSDLFTQGLSTSFLSALYNGLTEAVLVIELETCHIVYWNKGAEAMFGYPAAETLGKSLQILYPDQLFFQRNLETIRPVIQREGYWRGESEYLRRDASRFTGEVTATRVEDKEVGQPQVVIVIRDITKRKRAEEHIQRLNRELERRVHERTSQLESVVESLKKEISERKRAEEKLREADRMATLGSTAARLAHEIGNPLNGMHTTLQLLERQLIKERGDHSDDALMMMVQDLKNEIERLRSLLDDLRGFSRPLVLDLKPTDLPALVEEILHLEEPECRKKGIECQWNFQPGLPPVIIDSFKIKQVLLNLWKNALEAMPEGGTLTVRAHCCSENVHLEIEDTGEGIPEGTPIFDLYMTTKPHGTGLGLVIVQQIIAAHKGSISYKSKPGKGTTFCLTLPTGLKSIP